MKKWISLILVFAMMLAMIPVASARSQTRFIDVPDTHWAASAIAQAVQAGYVSGYEDGTFKPDKPVSRAEFIKMTVEAMGYEMNHSEGSWYVPYINAALAGGLITANEYGSQPDYTVPMTRREMARIAVRAIGRTVQSDAEYMLLAVQNGLLSGTGNGELAPDGTTTRAQAVAVIGRILQVNQGRKLPVDELAVAAASSAVKLEQMNRFGTIRSEQRTSDEERDIEEILGIDLGSDAYDLRDYFQSMNIQLDWEYAINHTDPGMNAVAHGSGLYVAVGNDGVVKTSRDAKVWDILKLDYDGDLVAVVWGGNQFVAAGTDGTSRHTIFTSKDGLNWKKVYAGKDGSIKDLAWNGRVYVAVGTLGLILTSTDGEKWVKRDHGIASQDNLAKQLNAVEWGNGTFVAMTHYGRALYSKDGSKWESVLLPVEYEKIWNMAYGNQMFVAVGDYAIHISKDGRNWTKIKDPKAFWSRIDFVHDRFILFGTDYADSSRKTFKRKSYYSKDGKTWKPFEFDKSHDASPRLTVHNGSEFVTIMNGGIQISKDGVRWTKFHQYPMNGEKLNSVAHHDGQYVFVGGALNIDEVQKSSRAVILVLENGKWSSTVIREQYPLYDVTWTGTRYLGVGHKGTMMVSADGKRWNLLPKVTEENLHSVELLNNVIYVTGSNGLIMTSRDGRAWTKHQTPVRVNLRAIAWNGKDTWVAAGDNGLVLVSNDGFKWVHYNIDAKYKTDWQDVVWGDGQFAVAGAWGGLMKSRDGRNWEGTNLEGDYRYTHFYGITYANGMYLAVGMNGRILISRDLQWWFAQNEMTNVDLLDVKEIDGTIYVVGENGRIIVSTP